MQARACPRAESFVPGQPPIRSNGKTQRFCGRYALANRRTRQTLRTLVRPASQPDKPHSPGASLYNRAHIKDIGAQWPTHTTTTTSPSSPICAASCWPWARTRSEEHTSELQSRENLVCRLLLEKK